MKSVRRRAPGTVVTQFVEARIGRLADGTFVSDDPNMSHGRWAVFLPTITSPILATRSRRVDAGTQYREVGGIVRPLSYYVGLRRAILKIPYFVRDIDRAVQDSDVVVARLPGLVGMTAVFCAVARRKPLAAEVVGDIRAVIGSAFTGGRGRFAARVAGAATAWCVRRAGAVRYVTNYTLQELYPAGTRANTVSVSGVSIAGVDRQLNKVVKGRIVAVGSQEQMYKGHDVLIAALAELKRAGNDVHLHLVGQGRNHEQLKSLARSLGVEAEVVFVPVINSSEEMNMLLDSAEVFAMPSITEGLPRVLIEAMARGAACVGSNVGGIPELLSPEVLCVSADSTALAELIASFHNDPALRERHSQRNMSRALEFTETVLSIRRHQWSEMVKNLAEKS